MRVARIFQYFCLVMSIYSSASTLASTSEKPIILVVGDSLSAAYGISSEQGWVHLLQQKLTQQHYAYHVVNASISGETSIGGRNRLNALLQQYQPKLLLLELGANDGLRGLSLKNMKSNLSAMIESAQQQHVQVVLIGMRIPSNYGTKYTEAFFQSFAQLAKKYNTAYVPFLLDGIATDMTLFQADGIHPTAQAQPRLLETIWQHLHTLLETTSHLGINTYQRNMIRGLQYDDQKTVLKN